MKKVFKKIFIPNIKSNPTPLFWHPISVGIFTIFTICICIMSLLSSEVLKPGTLLGDIRTGVIAMLTNQERQQQNLPQLNENELLTQAAEQKAQDMATNQYFAHYSPQGVSPWFWFSQVGYQYDKAGENLAVLFTDSEQVVHAWMDSPTHRANILKDGYTEIGIGTAEGFYKGKKTTYIVQLFAKPKNNSNQIFFKLETQNKNVDPNLDIRGIEIVNFSVSTLMSKEYILLTILFIVSVIIFILSLVSLTVFFIKHSHNKAIVRRYVFYIFISCLCILYLYINFFQNIF